MKRLIKYIINPEHIVIAFLTIVILGVACLIVVNISFLNPVSEAIDDFSMTDMFYEIEHSGTIDSESSVISIVDLTNVYDRGEIGEILANISMCNPKAIGVDIIFEGEKDDSIGNKLLTDAIRILPKSTIFAEKLTNYSSENDEFSSSVKSFFADSLHVRQGFTNFVDNLAASSIREMPAFRNLSGQDVIAFDVALSEMCGIKVTANSDDNYIINYKNIKFTRIPPDSIFEYSDYIEDRVILVGTLNEEADMHSTPVGKMPGVEIHAYSLLALLENHRVIELNEFWLILIAIVICWILELCICGTYKVLKRKEGNALRSFLSDSSIPRDFLLTCTLVVLCWLSFSMFVFHNILIEATVIFGAIAVLPMAIELYEPLVNTLYKKKGWKWLERSNYIDK